MDGFEGLGTFFETHLYAALLDVQDRLGLVETGREERGGKREGRYLVEIALGLGEFFVNGPGTGDICDVAFVDLVVNFI